MILSVDHIILFLKITFSNETISVLTLILRSLIANIFV